MRIFQDLNFYNIEIEVLDLANAKTISCLYCFLDTIQLGI